MRAGLQHVFSDVFGKILAPTECLSEGVSKTQAIQVGGAKRMLGEPSDKVTFLVRYVYVDERASRPLECTREAVLSDTRRNQAGRSPEWRLGYRQDNAVMQAAAGGDLVWVAKDAQRNDQLTVIVVPPLSDAAPRLDRMFGTGLVRDEDDPGVPQVSGRLLPGAVTGLGGSSIDVDDAELLRKLGIPVETPHGDLFERFLGDLSGEPVSLVTGMAPNAVMASLVRGYRPGLPIGDPDGTLVGWWELSSELFFLYERHIVGDRLNIEFGPAQKIDVDRFVAVALSVLNTRKSRAGSVFEEHLHALFSANGLDASRVSRLADRSRPDFVLPSRDAFEDDATPLRLLTFLGAKTTARERWRQQVAEATKIEAKHFATLDPSITTASLQTMRRHQVIPVVPRPIIEAAYAGRSEGILDLAGFIGDGLAKQSKFREWATRSTPRP